MRRLFLVLYLSVVVSFPAGAAEIDWNLVMGMPSRATNPDQNHGVLPEAVRNNYLVKKRHQETAPDGSKFWVDDYALSYNNAKGEPNWVSWHLSNWFLGTAPRKSSFDTDLTLTAAAGFRPITHDDYSHSGFDRGHMCPHNDRAKTTLMSFATFIMSNIVPQSPANNRGAWEALERYGRILAKDEDNDACPSRHCNKDLFIVSGPLGQGGIGQYDTATPGHPQRGQVVNTIANGKVVVPAYTFKVIMVLDGDRSRSPLDWINDNTRLIAVKIPNSMNVHETLWAGGTETRNGQVFQYPDYRVSVAEVERATGFTFFSDAMAHSAANRRILAAKKLVKDRTPIPYMAPTPHGPAPVH